MLCERICPDFAIYIEKVDDEEGADKPKGKVKGKKGAKA
jgi:formate hydrogenlyase subunit 6/NADH:ubiquinone oxidoreductase subunit I